MTTLRFIISFYLLLLLSSCKGVVDIPDSNSESPVFKTNILIDNVSTELSAGENNYHNEASHSKNGGLFLFQSTFKDQSCSSGCPNSFSIKIYGDNENRNTLNIDDEITTGEKSFFSKYLIDRQTLTLRHTSKGNPDKSIFIYNNERTQVNNSKEVSIVVPRNEKLNICLEDHLTGVSMSSQCFEINEQRQAPPHSLLTLDDPTIALFKATLQSNFDPQRTAMIWTPGNTNGDSYKINPVDAVGQEICVTTSYKDNTSGQSRACIELYRDVRSFEVVSAFELGKTGDILNPDDEKKGRIVMEYINEKGGFYTTELYQQTGKTFFEIMSIKDFYDPTIEEDIKLLELRFSARLYSTAYDYIDITSTSTTMAIRYQ